MATGNGAVAELERERDSSRRMRVAIVTGAHLCRNPRVLKEADALADSGFEIRIFSPILDPALAAIDDRLARAKAWSRHLTVNLRHGGGLRARIRNRIGRELNARFRLDDFGALGYGLARTLSATRAWKPDLVIGHQETGLWVVWKLLGEGQPVAVDIEDWYSRDLLPEARRARPLSLLQRMERDVLSRARVATTTSRAMAEALARYYGCPEPVVVYNAFEPVERPPAAPVEDGRLQLCWFSQTIGPGRGLELLTDALPLVASPCTIRLIGRVSDGYRIRLAGRIGSKHRVMFEKPIDPDMLGRSIAQSDAGLALDPDVPENKDLTVSNKILQFLSSGLPVIATRTCGQDEVARLAGDAIVSVEQTSVSLATAVNALLDRKERLRRAASSRVAAYGPLGWAASRSRLVEAYATAFGQTRAA